MGGLSSELQRVWTRIRGFGTSFIGKVLGDQGAKYGVFIAFTGKLFFAMSAETAFPFQLGRIRYDLSFGV